MKLSIASASLICAGLLLPPMSSWAQAQNADPQSATQKTGKPAEIEPKSAEGKTATQDHWDPSQILTVTVQQAWLLSNKNEATFFEMVEQLADISAKNRGIALPESEAAGRRMGEYIKKAAAADTDQLLYAVVDKAVMLTAKPAAHTTAKTK